MVRNICEKVTMNTIASLQSYRHNYQEDSLTTFFFSWNFTS